MECDCPGSLTVWVAEMDCDHEACAGICADNDRDLSILDEVHVLEAGIGVLGAAEYFIMLLEP